MPVENHKQRLTALKFQGILRPLETHVSLCECCGAMNSSYVGKILKRIYWSFSKDIPKVYRDTENIMVIPDKVGNLLLQWDDV